MFIYGSQNKNNTDRQEMDTVLDCGSQVWAAWCNISFYDWDEHTVNPDTVL